MQRLSIALIGIILLGSTVQCSVHSRCLPYDGSCSPLLTLFLFQNTRKYMYVSSQGVNANYGGITGVDSACVASKPSTLSGSNFKGLLMTPARNQSTNWVLIANTEYLRADGTSIGRTNSSALFTFPLTNPVQTTGVSVWTGAAVVDANTWSSSTNCADWTQNISTGFIGSSNGTTSTMIANGFTSCATALYLYCVEQ